MKTMQMAILLLRLFAIYLFFDVIVVLTELPAEIFNILTSRIDYIVSEHEFVLAMTLVRLLIYTVAGICFLVLARPMAKLFTRGLEE
jgi:hypothetical protein